jgi:hypothetical protein|tara:strand:- start:156 stop:848 length:693 start_codon:yes stop_codon:yes gene_type:complete
VKKFLGIIVLSLLLQGCALFEGGVSTRNSPGQLQNVELNWHLNSPAMSEVKSTAVGYCNQQGIPDLSPHNLRRVYKAQGISISNSEWDEWRFDCLTKNQIASSNISNNNASSASLSSSQNANSKIAQSKQICRDLGFKVKTEKFADCALKMMSIQFESTNKVASTSGGTTQEIIVKHQNDYDIWDALLDVSFAIQANNKQTTSSSSSNRGTNCVIGRTNPTFGTTTMNCN